MFELFWASSKDSKYVIEKDPMSDEVMTSVCWDKSYRPKPSTKLLSQELIVGVESTATGI